MRAIALFKESLEKQPDNPIIHYHLGMACYDKGDHELAEKELAASLKIKGDYDGADEAKRILGELKKVTLKYSALDGYLARRGCSSVPLIGTE